VLRSSRRPFSDTDRKSDSDWHRLSRREQQVIRLLATGLSPKQIATVLGLSPNTVRGNCISICRVLNVRGLTALRLLLHTSPGWVVEPVSEIALLKS
jgi:DNA-binding CsgD family transcriptional regulator